MPVKNGQFYPMPPFFYVKVSIQKQKERKEKEGSLFIVTDSKNEARNLQQGEIIGIGEYAASLFPQAKIGHTLIMHWMAESKEKNQLVTFDEDYNYYVVTATDHNGQVNQSYGVWDGNQIIPHPDYIFISMSAIESDVDLDSLNEELKKNAPRPTMIFGANMPMSESNGGLLVFKDWKETRTDQEQRMAKINAEIQSLTKSKMTDQVRQGIQRKENELAEISGNINKQRIEFYKIAAINPDFNEAIERSFGEKVAVGDKIGMLNAACHTTVNFMGTEYIVALSKHFHGPHKWFLDAINRYKQKAVVETTAVF